MKKLYGIAALLGALFLISGCSKQTPSNICPITSGGVVCGTSSGVGDHSDLSGAIHSVLLALKNEDFTTLAQFVGEQGLRFSPYEHVNTGTDIVLSTAEVMNAATISRSYLWGSYDGSGKPIDLGIGQYFQKFVRDADYMHAPEILYNQTIQRGNTLNNLAQVYVHKQWVEFYFSGFDPKYSGMDWKSLTLVFEEVDKQRQLIGIVHGSWTI
ncbi:MAG: hypothetical protein NTY80_05120 [candidate division SR1 bacterium]|nr:hypothetical protein [candidate division SR1 bacterium]